MIEDELFEEHFDHERVDNGRVCASEFPRGAQLRLFLSV
jgi:hypothetical protein